jgi:hypothetical protein
VFSEDGDYFEIGDEKMVKLKPSAWITLANFGIIGTATRFKHGQYFELTGTRGNVWLFNIDEVLALAKKSKNKEHKAYALQIEKDVNSKIGLNVGFPLAYLINNVTEDFGDDAVISLNRSKGNPDDRPIEKAKKMKDEIEQIFKAYLKRKIEKHKFRKDNKPYTR